MEGSKADFSHLFSIVTEEKLSEYRKQYEVVEYTGIITDLCLGSVVELDEETRMIVRPTKRGYYERKK